MYITWFLGVVSRGQLTMHAVHLEFRCMIIDSVNTENMIISRCGQYIYMYMFKAQSHYTKRWTANDFPGNCHGNPAPTSITLNPKSSLLYSIVRRLFQASLMWVACPRILSHHRSFDHAHNYEIWWRWRCKCFQGHFSTIHCSLTHDVFMTVWLSSISGSNGSFAIMNPLQHIGWLNPYSYSKTEV